MKQKDLICKVIIRRNYSKNQKKYPYVAVLLQSLDNGKTFYDMGDTLYCRTYQEARNCQRRVARVDKKN